MSHPDVIVIGLGAMGSAACWQLARRGARVLGLEQFSPGHTLGSSHGHTRIIRTAYYEHPDYVPLVRRAFSLWYDLEQASGQSLLIDSPCLTLGPPGCELVTGVLGCAEQHALAVERLSRQEVERRFPAFRVPDDAVGVVEEAAGYLRVEDSVQALQAAACAHGAELRHEEPVLSWTARPGDDPAGGAGGSVSVTTGRGTYRAARLVVAAGPWAGQVLAGAGVPLSVMRQVAFWLAPGDMSRFRRDNFPVFIADTPGGYFYGFPAADSAGVKIARHYGAPEVDGPQRVSRQVTPGDEAPVRAFARTWLPDSDGPVRRSSTCLYTLTPDRHFVLDNLPGQPVTVAAGFSGHGFKFAPAVGEVLADLALSGRTKWPVGLFRLGRFSDR